MLDEDARYRLHQRLEFVLGPEEAGTLMASLPPEGWRELATRRDLENQGALLRSDLAQQGAELRSDMAELRTDVVRELRAQTWRLVTLLVPSIVAVAGLAVAAPHI